MKVGVKNALIFLLYLDNKQHSDRYYSLNPKKATVGHKNCSFCEQTLHKGLIDASCNWLQYTTKNRGQNNFLRKLRAKIQFLRLLFSSLRSISSYNPHTILKNARRGRLKIYIYFHLQKLQVGPVDASCQERQYATKNRARRPALTNPPAPRLTNPPALGVEPRRRHFLFPATTAALTVHSLSFSLAALPLFGDARTRHLAAHPLCDEPKVV